MSATGRSTGSSIYGPPPRGRRLVFAWVRNPIVDFGAPVLLLPWLLLPLFTDIAALITYLDPSARQAIYQTLTALSATLAGFVLTSVSVLINLMRAPLSALDKVVDEQNKAAIGGAFLAALRPLAAIFVASLLALMTDVQRAVGNPVTQFFVFGMVAAALSGIMRVAWVMRRLLRITNSGAGG